MTKKWTTIQIIIASILQAWALHFIYTFTEQIINRLHQGAQLKVIKSADISASFGSLFRLYHINYFTAILAFCGGFALIYDKKWGWIASAASSLIFMGFMLVSGRNGVIGQGSKGGYSISYLVAGLVFAAMFILLVLKPFRVKFQANFANWLVIGGLAMLVLIDKQVF
jgi:hypothetical protein